MHVDPLRTRRLSHEESDQRSPFRRDRDRLLYSRELRRLAGVTQVARADETGVFHDRLSHSWKVAQVGDALVDILMQRPGNAGYNIRNRLDRDIVETAALAHDLGHPPFGHAVEDVLDDIVDDDYGGFEGNAQSFRIVTKLAVHRKSHSGLNLTRASLNAVLKYPWGIDDPRKGEEDKWGFYPTELDEFRFARRPLLTDKPTIEAQVMDYADDLTYAVHDVEDFYRAGLVPLDQILANTGERRRFAEYVEGESGISKVEVGDFFDRLREHRIATEELETPFRGTEDEIASVNRFTSTLIQRYLNPFGGEDVSVEGGRGRLVLSINDELEREIKILKLLTKMYVIDNTTLASQQHGQREIVRHLFEYLDDQIEEDEDLPTLIPSNVIPTPFREHLSRLMKTEEIERQRTIVDVIVSMTERQTVNLYERLSGHAPGSLSEDIFR